MNQKRGMGIGQVFVFIVAGITFAFIMIFGYKMISDFMGKGETVQFVQFKNDLEGDIKKIYTEYGAIRIENYVVASKYQQICFVDLDTKPSNEERAKLCSLNQYACDLWQEAWINPEKTGYQAIDENVFLTPSEGTTAIKVHRLAIAEGEENRGFLCLRINKGSFSLVLEGKGDHTEISTKN